jgi:asparagine synthase (glutamine-hydrolysing)
MCGIAGFWDPSGLTADSAVILRRMTDAIRHRGPDADGHWFDPEAGVALGHRRLSILDLSVAGSQPMVSPSGRYVLTYNGEIYNWRELRRQEEQFGARWRGHSDTEVFLALCDRVGIREAVRRSSGMFAMGIWDTNERRLTLVRDRVGEKPLYYGWVGGALVFGSELGALRCHPAFGGALSSVALTLFLRHGYIPGPLSIYSGIHKLPPGTTLEFNAGDQGVPEPVPYWSIGHVATTTPDDYGSGTDVVEQLDVLLGDVVARQMISDVPIGAFLSGGIDSSLIVALMQARASRRVKTFTIGFAEQAYDEAPFARQVAAHLGTDHTEWYVTDAEAASEAPRIAALYDEPFADASQVPTALLTALTRRHVSVALSGDGGDEVFSGYDRYRLGPTVVQWQRRVGRGMARFVAKGLTGLPPRAWDAVFRHGPAYGRFRLTGDRIHKLGSLLGARGPGGVYRTLTTTWPDAQNLVVGGDTGAADSLSPRIPDDAHGDAFVAAMMVTDTRTYLPDDIFVKVDRAAMAVSLETRAPLVTPEVIKFAWRLPRQALYAQGRGKLPLRQVLARYVPPALTERPKQGFALPIEHWLRGRLRDWACDTLRADRLTALGLHAAPIQKVLNAHLRGERNWQYRLWAVLMLSEWARATMDHS